jgi:hypothetical protein
MFSVSLQGRPVVKHLIHPESFQENSNSTDNVSVSGKILGEAVSNVGKKGGQFKINIATILISALLFLLVLGWFDFIQSTFLSWISPREDVDDVPSIAKLAYALLITIFVLTLIMLVYYYSFVS